MIKKPLQKRSKAKFQAILASCPQVLNAFGYRKTTTAKMALEADVSIGTLYNYFSCKEAVFLAYLDEQLNRALDAVLQASENDDLEPVAFIREFVRIGVDFGYQHKAMLKVALREFPEELLNPDLTESRDKILRIIANVYSNKRFLLRNREPRIAIYTLTNLILGFQFRTVVMPDEALPRDALVDELTDIVAHYIFELPAVSDS